MTAPAITLPVSVGDILVRTEGFRDNRPCIRGTGITVHNIAARHLRGDSVETIAEDLPRATLAGIYAALAYFHLHRDEVEADWDADEIWAKEMAATGLIEVV